MCLVDRIVCTGAHEGTHSDPGVRSSRIDVHDILHHNVVQQEPVYGAVAALDESVLEPALVQPLDAFFAAIARAEKLDVRVWVVGKHVDYFVVEALVEVVAILEVDFADFCLVWTRGISTLSPDDRDFEIKWIDSPATRETSFCRAATCFLSSASSPSMMSCMRQGLSWQ